MIKVTDPRTGQLALEAAELRCQLENLLRRVPRKFLMSDGHLAGQDADVCLLFLQSALERFPVDD